jgi:hypothetical protein
MPDSALTEEPRQILGTSLRMTAQKEEGNFNDVAPHKRQFGLVETEAEQSLEGRAIAY